MFLYWVPDTGFVVGILSICILASLSIIGFITAPWLCVLGAKKNKKWLIIMSLLFYFYGVIGLIMISKYCYLEYKREQSSHMHEKKTLEEENTQQRNNLQKEIEEYRNKLKDTNKQLSKASEEKENISNKIRNEMQKELFDLRSDLEAAKDLYRQSRQKEKKLSEENEELTRQNKEFRSSTNPQQNP